MASIVAELVVIPAPGLGHIKSTVEFAKVLLNRDQHLSLTIMVIKPPSGDSGSAFTSYIQSLANNNSTLDRISFIELPQQKTLPMFDSKSPMVSFTEFINSHCIYIKNVVADMIGQPGSSRKVVGFVIDMLCQTMIDVANEFNVPTYLFFTSNANFLSFCLHIQTLCDDQNQDIIELSNLNTKITVPGFVKPVPTNVFPSMIQNKEGLDFHLWTCRRFREVKAILVNTFVELEMSAIQSITDDISIPPVYAVGPILNLEDGDGAGTGKPYDNGVISWLDTQSPSSVVFLCFGSMGSFDEIQVKEIAYGLEKSKHRFVWSLRRPPSEKTTIATGDYDNHEPILPEGFMERMDGIGKVIGWAPQVKLLAHPAIGGFVSHCGWNSLLESLWFGVPSATWPIYAEQQINAFEMVVELGLAVEIKLDYRNDLFYYKGETTVIVTAEEMENGIRQLMEDDKVRNKVKEMSEKSRATVVEGGSSYASIGRFVHDIIRNVSS
ncbi:anthocyanidin 3-O-glucosyltransferase 2-like [Rutidosis leptorrhynchoides]|uniref:anthocyanidin 3-O-glucosyltransferase 2-like n=1 Tax=Rutidosis leptorrhynchoides TaxID=125765 RepID=UPI003A99CCBA